MIKKDGKKCREVSDLMLYAKEARRMEFWGYMNKAYLPLAKGFAQRRITQEVKKSDRDASKQRFTGQ